MCEYCNAEVYFKTQKVMKSLLAPATYIDKLRQELEDITGESYIKVDNLYCPMCGREFGGNNE